MGNLLRDINFGGVIERNTKLLKVKDSAGQPVDYEAEIMKVDAKTSSTGNQMFEITLKTSFPVEDAGVSMWDNLTMNETSLWKLKSILRACDLLSADGAAFIGRSEQEMVGNIVRFQIKHDEYEGVFKNKVATGYSAGFETPGLPGAAPVVPIQPAQGPVPNFGPV